jgi:eukaryotic-like serine/threonine-protein kinase
MALAVGAKLGPYEILAPIGAGGMGEVWKARDTRLYRIVAIKISKEKFTERFEREARIVASLNHPNICHLYDVGPDYLVMELIEGPTLQQRIQRGAIPLDEALAIARQIADALDSAHEKGIVHRDLKPANIKLKPDGTVKVLDFGLAKLPDLIAADASDASHSPTITMGATAAGVILGTAGYMAPEQAKGRPVDRRADVWAFGVVLYEMLSGRKAFDSDDVSEILAAILRVDVDWSALPFATPAYIRALLRHCLEKDPKRRLRDFGDVSILLEAAPGRPEETRSRIVAQGTSGLLWAGVALFAVAVVLGFAVYFRPTSPAAQVFNVSVTLPEKAEFGASPPAVSPDGRRIAFVAHSSGKDSL